LQDHLLSREPWDLRKRDPFPFSRPVQLKTTARFGKQQELEDSQQTLLEVVLGTHRTYGKLFVLSSVCQKFPGPMVWVVKTVSLVIPSLHQSWASIHLKRFPQGLKISKNFKNLERRLP
jgi:hypothetical protein